MYHFKGITREHFILFFRRQINVKLRAKLPVFKHSCSTKKQNLCRLPETFSTSNSMGNQVNDRDFNQGIKINKYFFEVNSNVSANVICCKKMCESATGFCYIVPAFFEIYFKTQSLPTLNSCCSRSLSISNTPNQCLIASCNRSGGYPSRVDNSNAFISPLLPRPGTHSRSGLRRAIFMWATGSVQLEYGFA